MIIIVEIKIAQLDVTPHTNAQENKFPLGNPLINQCLVRRHRLHNFDATPHNMHKMEDLTI